MTENRWKWHRKWQEIGIKWGDKIGNDGIRWEILGRINDLNDLSNCTFSLYD